MRRVPDYFDLAAEKLAVLGEAGTNWTWYYFQLAKRLAQVYYHFRPNDGVRVVDEEWDALIILDGCRYDDFDDQFEASSLGGTLESRRSLGSATPGFLKENFRGGTYEEVVYVTANPFVETRLDDPFYETRHVWKDRWQDGTVRPEAVTDAALHARRSYPEKKLVVHYMQPHEPFIGAYRPKHDGHLWEIALRDSEDARRAYRSNLELVFPHVERLAEAFEGTTVVTSDHGNAFGEGVPPLGLPIYGHPDGVHAECLVRVPWLELE